MSRTLFIPSLYEIRTQNDTRILVNMGEFIPKTKSTRQQLYGGDMDSLLRSSPDRGFEGAYTK